MKKFITVLALASVFVACNNAGEAADNTKDSLDSIAKIQKENLDSTAKQTEQAIDSTTEAQKRAADSTNIVNDSTNR